MPRARADILLNAKQYVLREISPGVLIRRRQLPIFPPTQTPAPDRVSRNALTPIWTQNDFTGGLGLAEVGVLDPAKRNRFWWSTCDTRWSRYVEPAPLNVTETGVSDYKPVKYVDFKGDLWGLFEGAYSASVRRLPVSRKYGATSDDWTGGGTVIAGADTTASWGHRAFDMVEHKGSLFALSTQDDTTNVEISYMVSSSSDGVTWAGATGTGWDSQGYLTTTITRRNNFDDDYGRLLAFGNNLLAAIRGDASTNDGSVLVQKTTDSGSNWSVVATLPTGDGPKAFVSWYNRAGSNVPVLILAEGLYEIDLTNNLAPEIYRFGGANANNGRWATVASDGNLYVGMASGDIFRFSLGAGTLGDQYALHVDNLGPATKAAFTPSDGLPTAYQGRANFILGSDPSHLYVAYGGHAASRNATILAMDYQTGAWHHIHNYGTANVDLYLLHLSDEDDGTMRLHSVAETGPVLFMFEDPLRPHWISGAATQASGILQRPYQHFDADGLAKAFLRVLVRADDLSSDATGEYMTYKYGINGAARTTTNLGNLLSGTKQLDVASGAGVSVNDIGDELTLTRDAGDTTQSPKLASISMFYDVARGELEAWEMIIDIPETARRFKKNRETVITDIETVRNSAILVAFQDTRLATASYVRLLPVEWLESYPVDKPSDVKPERISYAHIRIEERLA